MHLHGLLSTPLSAPVAYRHGLPLTFAPVESLTALINEWRFAMEMQMRMHLMHVPTLPANTETKSHTALSITQVSPSLSSARIKFTRRQHRALLISSTLAKNTMDNQTPAQPVRATRRTEMDDLEHAFGEQMAITSANPEKRDPFKRLNGLARKHDKITVC